MRPTAAAQALSRVIGELDTRLTTLDEPVELTTPAVPVEPPTWLVTFWDRPQDVVHCCGCLRPVVRLIVTAAPDPKIVGDWCGRCSRNPRLHVPGVIATVLDREEQLSPEDRDLAATLAKEITAYEDHDPRTQRRIRRRRALHHRREARPGR